MDAQNTKSLLRLITCGSVDDGKSTLIGRLLYDSKIIFDDQLAQLKNESARYGTQGKEIDFALLVDGLSAERQQGITIDVAYRFFSTEKRKFIIADTPGHEQYTRNMVTAASTADIAVILVDARKGIKTQTRRHTFLCFLLGVKNICLAVNKMDLINYDKKSFLKIVSEYKNFIKRFRFNSFEAIPISALMGDNVVTKSNATNWYKGSSLTETLNRVSLDRGSLIKKPFRMPVQWVNRKSSEFRGYTGKVESGLIKKGDKITIQPSGHKSIVDRIVVYQKDLKSANAGQSITLTFKDELECSRGEIVTCDKSPLEVTDQFKATLIWMSKQSLVPRRLYLLKLATETVPASIAPPQYQINVNTMEHVASKTLDLNDIGVANVTLEKAIPFTSYEENKNLGSFILIDRITNATIGAGLISFALRRYGNIHWQALDVNRDKRAAIKNQKPMVLWLTGLSGSGKSTIANAIEKKLVQRNYHTILLDGDNIRHGLNKDLGFTGIDRVENIRRIGEIAKLMTDAGLIVITAFISPFKAEREMVRKIMEQDEFNEIFIDTPLKVAETRDVKGLYAKARAGKIKNFTGIDSPYEKPQNPDIRIDTTKTSINEAAEIIIKLTIK